MRSKLFVPGTRSELFAKAQNSQADAISLDLEDSVVESRKDEARDKVVEFLCSSEVAASDKTIIVRVNNRGTAHFESDILAVTKPAVDMVNLPKVESAKDVCAAVEILEKAEKANGVIKTVKILATIETPKGLLSATEVASAHPRVAGLQLGLNDLFESLSIDRQDNKNVHATMLAMRMAAGGANIFAYDGAFADFNDENGFRIEAEMAHRLGYLGKSCIHPCQVAIANEVFVHNEDDVTFALRVLEEYKIAAAEGIGAFSVDGKMIDLPIIRRAEAVVAASRRLQKQKHTDTIVSDES